MFRVKSGACLYPTTVAAVLLLLCGGCGSGVSSSNSMSEAQVQAVTAQVSQSMAQALESAFSSNVPAANRVRSSLSTAVRDSHSRLSSPCAPATAGENCNWPISYSGPCPEGGTISVAGDVDGSLNGTGAGSVQSQLTITPANCSISGQVISGDPSISVNGQIHFAETAPVFPINLIAIGAISYGPNRSEICQLNVTYTINSATNCRTSGMACGQPVNGSC